MVLKPAQLTTSGLKRMPPGADREPERSKSRF